MRTPLLLSLCLLSCCGPAPFGVLAAVDVASIAVLGRGVGDIGVSAITGRDCSIVRLDRGLSYCAGPDTVPTEAYCTRSLATVDCWPTRTHGPGVGDTPPTTLAQQRYREAPWPKALTATPP